MSRIKEYKTKAENYDIGQRLSDLVSITQTQLDCTTSDSEYMRGMANGLLLAVSIMRDPYGAEVAYVKSDIDTSR